MDGVTWYRTTDLELYSAEDLTALAAALEARGLSSRVTRLTETEWFCMLHADGEGPYDAPEPQVAALLAAVEALDPPSRAAWAGCSQRVFDLGYDCGTKPFVLRHDLSAGTLARLVAAGGSLRVTLYALDPSEIRPAEPGAAPDSAGM